MKLSELFEESSPKYIEDTDNQESDQHEKDIVYSKKLVGFIKAYCSDWLSQSDNGRMIVYRGIKNVKRSPFELAFIKDVWQDRQPRDSSATLHQFFNDSIIKAGRVANRSNSMFVTASISAASAYSEKNEQPFIVIPIGQFNYTWSTDFGDWSEEVNPDDDRGTDLYFPETIRGDDGSLKRAINSNHEIMIKCNSAIYISIPLYELYIKPLMRGDKPTGYKE